MTCGMESVSHNGPTIYLSRASLFHIKSKALTFECLLGSVANDSELYWLYCFPKERTIESVSGN